MASSQTPFEYVTSPVFQKVLEDLLSRFPKSRVTIENYIIGVVKTPFQGDVYPGFGSEDFQVRKVRFPLKEYKEGKSRGLRFIYLLNPKKKAISPLHIYKKGDYKQEHKVLEDIRTNLKSILKDLPAIPDKTS